MLDGRVRRLLAEPSKWTKTVMARDKYGDPVMEDDDAACSFCLVGAIKKLYGNGEQHAAYKAIQVLVPGIKTVTMFNDSAMTTHSDILKILDASGV